MMVKSKALSKVRLAISQQLGNFSLYDFTQLLKLPLSTRNTTSGFCPGPSCGGLFLLCFVNSLLIDTFWLWTFCLCLVVFPWVLSFLFYFEILLLLCLQLYFLPLSCFLPLWLAAPVPHVFHLCSINPTPPPVYISLCAGLGQFVLLCCT